MTVQTGFKQEKSRTVVTENGAVATKLVKAKAFTIEEMRAKLHGKHGLVQIRLGNGSRQAFIALPALHVKGFDTTKVLREQCQTAIENYLSSKKLPSYCIVPGTDEIGEEGTLSFRIVTAIKNMPKTADDVKAYQKALKQAKKAVKFAVAQVRFQLMINDMATIQFETVVM